MIPPEAQKKRPIGFITGEETYAKLHILMCAECLKNEMLKLISAYNGLLIRVE